MSLTEPSRSLRRIGTVSQAGEVELPTVTVECAGTQDAALGDFEQLEHPDP